MYILCKRADSEHKSDLIPYHIWKSLKLSISLSVFSFLTLENNSLVFTRKSRQCVEYRMNPEQKYSLSSFEHLSCTAHRKSTVGSFSVVTSFSFLVSEEEILLVS